MTRFYKPETKPTGKPPANKKLTAKQRKTLEQREAEEATEVQRRLKAECAVREAERREREARKAVSA